MKQKKIDEKESKKKQQIMIELNELEKRINSSKKILWTWTKKYRKNGEIYGSRIFQ